MIKNVLEMYTKDNGLLNLTYVDHILPITYSLDLSFKHITFIWDDFKQ